MVLELTYKVDTKKFDRDMAFLNKKIPYLLSDAVKELSHKFMKEVIDPAFIPIDTGMARAGFGKGAKAAVVNFLNIGTIRTGSAGMGGKKGQRQRLKGSRTGGVAEGLKLSRGKLTKRKFVASNLVPYIAYLETSHAGRKAAKRYSPPRSVMATGSYKAFTGRAYEETINAHKVIFNMLVAKHLGPLL